MSTLLAYFQNWHLVNQLQRVLKVPKYSLVDFGENGENACLVGDLKRNGINGFVLSYWM